MLAGPLMDALRGSGDEFLQSGGLDRSKGGSNPQATLTINERISAASEPLVAMRGAGAYAEASDSLRLTLQAQQAVNLGGPEGGKIKWSLTWAVPTPLPEPSLAADDANEASADEVSIVWSA
jgi:hypothetical protein